MTHAKKTWTWLRNGNLKRETESILIATQNHVIRTRHIKEKTEKAPQNIRGRLCADRDETINHIISENSILAQNEFKTKHDWVDKVIYWKLCKKLKFDHTNRWFMNNPESIQENETRKLLWDFDIQTDHLTSPRRPDLIIINKKRENLQNCGPCCSSGPQSKIERTQKEG